ncbi:MAG TPA: flagellar motor switch phosphatase FliY [Bacillales bacterium]|nr:flagellar motor switch phosphatase FliY [Bacillales bacterium]
MSDDHMLSQEEIDALLNGQDDGGENDEINNYLSTVEMDAIGEIGNISFGSAATALSELLNQKVEITTPTLSIVKRSGLDNEFPHPHVAIFVKYTEGFKGSNVLVIKTKDASTIANLMMGGDGTAPTEEIGEMEMSAVQEAMNQMMGSASTSMSTVFNMKIDISPPKVEMMDFTENEEIDSLPVDDEMMLKVSFHLKVGDLIDSNIMHLLPIGFTKDMVAQLMQSSQDEEVEENVEAASINTMSEEQAPRSREVEPEVEKQSQPLPQQSKSSESQYLGSSSLRSRDVQSAVFSDFEETGDVQSETKNLNMLFDIPLQVTVELGRTQRTVKDILRLSPGSVIELDKLAGEPVDIYVNNKMIAKGEVVVIDENFGVRVTEIASQKDRIQKLQ